MLIEIMRCRWLQISLSVSYEHWLCLLLCVVDCHRVSLYCRRFQYWVIHARNIHQLSPRNAVVLPRRTSQLLCFSATALTPTTNSLSIFTDTLSAPIQLSSLSSLSNPHLIVSVVASHNLFSSLQTGCLMTSLLTAS